MAMRYLLGCLFFMSSMLFAQTLDMKLDVIPTAATQQTLQIKNEFISIIVNDSSEDTGRFAIETTLGDPKNNNDNFQPLIYGRPIPWTSYTTLHINGKPYIFGNMSTKQQRRSGTTLAFSPILHQTQSDQEIISDTLVDGIRVIQKLSFARSPITQVKDTALITYELINESETPIPVGIRLMMDTKLGLNDGAPFRLGIDEVTSEKSFSLKQLTDYWQAFDDLASPNVIAQGTLHLPELGITPPDMLYLVNWGTLADNPWDFSHMTGRPFIREGELEKDTALALFWNPKPLAPGEKFTYRTLYGLGGVTLSPGELSVGISAPAELPITSPKEILVMGYVHNAGGYDSYQTYASFIVSEGLSIVGGIHSTDIGVLHAGETRQIPIKLKLNRHKTPGNKLITLRVGSSTFDTNVATRNLMIQGAPTLQTALKAPSVVSLDKTRYFPIEVTLKNPNPYDLGPIEVSLDPNQGVTVADLDLYHKTIHRLRPEDVVTVNWWMKPIAQAGAEAAFTLSFTSPLTAPQTLSHSVRLIQEKTASRLVITPEQVDVGDYFSVSYYRNVDQPGTSPIRILFDKTRVSFIRFSVPEWLQKLPWQEKITQHDNHIEIDTTGLTLTEITEPIIRLHFKAIQPGTLEWVVKEGQTVSAQKTLLIVDQERKTP